jgi:hypothetical protein
LSPNHKQSSSIFHVSSSTILYQYLYQ